MEMTLQLQAEGQEVSSLTFLDSSHTFVAAHTSQYKAKLESGTTYTQAEGETEALCVFVNDLVSCDYAKVCTEGTFIKYL